MILRLVVLILVFSFAARAQGVFTQSGDKPVEIEADNGIEWQRDAKAYIARGNARARRDGVEIRADSLTAFYRDGADGDDQQIYRIDADGAVRVQSGNEKAFGDKGVYHIDESVFVLVGENLRLETETAVITARDTLEYWDKRRLVVARGDAIVTGKEGRLRADILTAHIGAGGGQGLEQIDAFGNVLVSTGTEIARGDEGVYNPRTGIARLCGNVRITRGKNQLNGECADVNLITGNSRLTGGRVQGIFTPAK